MRNCRWVSGILSRVKGRVIEDAIEAHLLYVRILVAHLVVGLRTNLKCWGPKKDPLLPHLSAYNMLPSSHPSRFLGQTMNNSSPSFRDDIGLQYLLLPNPHTFFGPILQCGFTRTYASYLVSADPTRPPTHPFCGLMLSRVTSAILTCLGAGNCCAGANVLYATFMTVLGRWKWLSPAQRVGLGWHWQWRTECLYF